MQKLSLVALIMKPELLLPEFVEAKVTGAALDSVRFDLKVGYWSQCGQYFQVKPNPSPVELSG